MPHVYADRVKEVTTSTGPGALTLGGAAPGGFRTFAGALAVGDTTDVCIEDPATGEWEVCAATLVGPATLQRGAIRASSTGERISFGGGTKHVFICLPAAEAMRRSEIEAALNGKADVGAADEATAEARVFRVTIGIAGKPSDGEVIPLFVAPFDLVLPAGLSGSVTVGSATATAECSATAGTAATGNSTFQLRAGASPIAGGTLTFAASQTTAARGANAQTAISAGTQVSLACPATADATLADVAVTLAFVKGG